MTRFTIPKNAGTNFLQPPPQLRIAAPLLILALSGCQSIPDAPSEVKIPVPVPCIETMPTAPALISDADLLALPDGPFVIALGIDRKQRAGYIAELEAVLQACVK